MPTLNISSEPGASKTAWTRVNGRGKKEGNWGKQKKKKHDKEPHLVLKDEGKQHKYEIGESVSDVTISFSKFKIE